MMGPMVSRIYKKCQQIQELSAGDWWIVMISLLLLPMIAVTLQLKGFRWAQAHFSRRISRSMEDLTRPVPQLAQVQLEQARRIARMVAIAAGHGAYRASCLQQSLLISWLLKRRGLDTCLRIGVSKQSDEFSAHAWLECGGEVLTESADVNQRFAVFDTIGNL